MIRVLVVSDSHGDRRTLRRIAELHREANVFVHLGDGYRDALALQEEYPFLTLAGNCDSLSCEAPAEREWVVGGVRFFAAHGHTFGVKHSLLRLSLAAQQRQAQVALFGHTHTPLIDRTDGLLLVNGGSVRDGGRYALIDIEKGKIFPHLERLGY